MYGSVPLDAVNHACPTAALCCRAFPVSNNWAGHLSSWNNLWQFFVNASTTTFSFLVAIKAQSCSTSVTIGPSASLIHSAILRSLTSHHPSRRQAHYVRGLVHFCEPDYFKMAF